MATKYLKTQYVFLRITGKMQTMACNYGHRSEITIQEDPIFGDEFLKSFIKCSKEDFEKALEKALTNIKNNTL